MDRLVISFLNTRSEKPDPLETPLGVARWWSGFAPPANVAEASTKPRYDAALAAELRNLRRRLEALLAGGAGGLPIAFRGDASDAMLFTIAHRAHTAMEQGTAARVRQCAAQACGRYFFDQTKNGSRRWCSLRCMERARAPRRRTLSE